MLSTESSLLSTIASPAFHQKVNNEDMWICEQVQAGVSNEQYSGGRFSFRHEETVHRFQNMVADSLSGKNMVVPENDADFDSADDLSQPCLE